MELKYNQHFENLDGNTDTTQEKNHNLEIDFDLIENIVLKAKEELFSQDFPERPELSKKNMQITNTEYTSLQERWINELLKNPLDKTSNNI